MKRLVSLMSAVAMLVMLAVPASAALSYNSDTGVVVITEMPSDAEIAEYAPSLNASYVKAEDATALQTWGGMPLKLKYQNKLTTMDVYKVTYDMADLGAFVNGYDSDFNPAYFGLYNITIGFDGSTLPAGYELSALKYTLPNGTQGNVSVGVDQGTGYLNALYTAAGVTNDTIYPVIDADQIGVISAEGTFKAEYVLAVPAGSEFTLSFADASVVYQKTLTNAATNNITCDNLVFGEKPLDDIIVTPVADAENKITLGKAWDVNFKYEAAKAYTATFTDLDEADEAKKTFVAELDFGGIAEWENGSRYSFVTLLKTTKTNVELAVTNN